MTVGPWIGLLLFGGGMCLAVGLVAFSVAACVRAFRRKPRRQAVLLAVALGAIIVIALVHGYLVDTGLVELPYLVTPAVFLMVLMKRSPPPVGACLAMTRIRSRRRPRRGSPGAVYENFIAPMGGL